MEEISTPSIHDLCLLCVGNEGHSALKFVHVESTDFSQVFDGLS